MASKKLGLPIRIPSEFAYKLCDYKICLGRICEDYLQNYEFWGACDLDAIWGRIRTFLTPRILAQHDIVTSGQGRVWGHFLVIRNTARLNDLYSKMPGFEEAVADTGSLHRLDERVITEYLNERLPRVPARLRRLRKWLPQGSPKVFWHWRSPVVSHGRMQSEAKTLGKPFSWESGRAFNHLGSELMYLHFHKYKESMRAEDFVWKRNPEKLLISSSGITLTHPRGQRMADAS
ncbi:MAG: hypothetical protein DWQ08_05065 [Proteobacteria bacterium]|nr:MAG: hypothetical protein DWQ08_05065 [Pseudomonadota bacterium]